MDLLRIPGLLMYMIRLCLARSAADRRNVKRVRTETEVASQLWVVMEEVDLHLGLVLSVGLLDLNRDPVFGLCSTRPTSSSLELHMRG